MQVVKNLSGRRVFDISDDFKKIELKIKGEITEIVTFSGSPLIVTHKTESDPNGHAKQK